MILVSIPTGRVIKGSPRTALGVAFAWTFIFPPSYLWFSNLTPKSMSLAKALLAGPALYALVAIPLACILVAGTSKFWGVLRVGWLSVLGLATINLVGWVGYIAFRAI